MFDIKRSYEMGGTKPFDLEESLITAHAHNRPERCNYLFTPALHVQAVFVDATRRKTGKLVFKDHRHWRTNDRNTAQILV